MRKYHPNKSMQFDKGGGGVNVNYSQMFCSHLRSRAGNTHCNIKDVLYG